MTIGEKIKYLRKKQGITQEKLAGYLNIAAQSVSKWENNIALPDISMVVPLAHFFGITTDELFDLESKNKESVLRDYEEKAAKLQNRGRVREELELWREATNAYPNDYHCLCKLAGSLFQVCASNGFSDAERVTARREGIVIGNRILDDCTDDEIRSSALQILTFLYSFNGDEEMAVKTAARAPSLYCSREILMASAYAPSSPRLVTVRSGNTMQLLDLLHQNILNTEYKNDPETLRACNALLTIWNALFYDENFLFYHCRIEEIYAKLATVYAKEKDKARTLDALRKTQYHARRYDLLPDEDMPYSGIFFEGATFDKSKTSKNYTETHIEMLRKLTANACFDFLRDDSDFIAFFNSFNGVL